MSTALCRSAPHHSTTGIFNGGICPTKMAMRLQRRILLGITRCILPLWQLAALAQPSTVRTRNRSHLVDPQELLWRPVVVLPFRLALHRCAYPVQQVLRLLPLFYQQWHLLRRYSRCLFQWLKAVPSVSLRGLPVWFCLHTHQSMFNKKDCSVAPAH